MVPPVGAAVSRGIRRSFARGSSLDGVPSLRCREFRDATAVVLNRKRALLSSAVRRITMRLRLAHA